MSYYSGKYGVLRRTNDQSNAIMCSRDKEKDFTIAVADTSLLTGAFDDLENIENYYALDVQNITDTTTTIELYYRVLGGTDIRKTILGPGSTFQFCQPCTYLCGTSNGTTAGSILKVQFIDKKVYNGQGDMYY